MAGRLSLLFAMLLALVVFSASNQSLFLTLHHGLQWLPAVCWRLLSMLGEWTLVIAVLLWQVSRQPQLLARTVLAVLAGIVAAILLKAGFAEPRPSLVLPAGSVRLLDVLPGNGAFPSGHAMAAALLSGLLLAGWALSWQLGGVVLVVLVCLSRLAIGVHWPQDVLAGAAVGYALATLAGLISPWTWRWTRALLQLLLLVSVAVALWKLQRGLVNESYLGYNLLVLLLAALAWRQNKNGA